jgi:hypothetical protein
MIPLATIRGGRSTTVHPWTLLGFAVLAARLRVTTQHQTKLKDVAEEE